MYHTQDREVEALFARVRREQGHLDLLVANAWGGYEHYFGETFDDKMVSFDGANRSKLIEAVEEVVGKGRVRASTRRPPVGPVWTRGVADRAATH